MAETTGWQGNAIVVYDLLRRNNYELSIRPT